MDLLFIGDTPPYPLKNISAVLLYYLARELRERRHDIDLVCFYDQPEDLAEVPRYERFFRDVRLVPKPALSLNVLQRRVRHPARRFPHQVDSTWSPEMWQTIYQFTSTRRYDVAQIIGDIPVYEYCELLQRLPSVIAIPFLRSLDLATCLKMADNWRQKRGLQREYKLFQAYEQWMYMPFDAVVVTTQTQAANLHNAIQHPAVVIPVGVDADYFVPTGYDPESSALLFIGDFTNPAEHRAALRLCQHIFPQIQRTLPEVKLYVIGDSPGTTLRPYASESIFIIEAAPDLRPYFELATLYISPLQQRMGIQQNILKSLAMMTPVVGTSASFEGLDVEHDQQVLIGENDDELIRRAIRLLRDSQERLRLQVNGLQRVQERYSWYQIANRYEALFQAMS